MSSIKNGGNAFPAEMTMLHKQLNTDLPDDELRTTIVKQGGMTLRDYFAAKAMQAFCSNIKTSFQEDAELAYRMADAMLEARK
jgi:hypothetical protein